VEILEAKFRYFGRKLFLKGRKRTTENVTIADRPQNQHVISLAASSKTIRDVSNTTGRYPRAEKPEEEKQEDF